MLTILTAAELATLSADDVIALLSMDAHDVALFDAVDVIPCAVEGTTETGTAVCVVR